MGMQRPSGIPVSNIMEVIFGNLSVLYVVKDLKQKLEIILSRDKISSRII